MIRFGNILFRAQHTTKDYATVKKVAIESERLGFDSIWVCDHFRSWPVASQDPVLEGWTTLSALSSETKKVRLGTMALCNSYRHPPVLAKMSSTLDVISGGRLEFGIGAGWYEKEYFAYGIPFPKASVRIEQLGEAVKIIKEMWTEEEATFEGEYYSVRGAFCSPKPVQKPHPPIWIAGMGEKYTLKVVAELADYCNFFGITPEGYERKLKILREYCSQIGRDLEQIQRSWSGVIVIAEDKRELEEKIEKFESNGILIRDDYLTGNLIIGTPERCLERIKNYVDVGVTYFVLHFLDVTETRPLQLFAEHIIRNFRE